MNNRLLSYFEANGAPEYWLVRGRWGYAYVSREVAQNLMSQLRRWLRPRWVCLNDLSGSQIWVLTSTIELIGESTFEQRAYDRDLRRQLEAEENDDNEGYQDFRSA